MNYTNNITLKQPFYKRITINFSSIIENILCILLTLAIILLLSNPSRYTKSVLAGSSLFYFSVMPSLLPFFFISKILFNFNLTGKFINSLGKPMTKIFKLPPVSSYIVFMSILCGYPVGAKLLGELYANGQLSKDDCKRILIVGTTSGPIFIIGSVGAGLFGDPLLGLYIFICHLLSSLITAILLTRKMKNNNTSTFQFSSSKVENILNDTVYSTIISIFTVAVYISVFYMFIDMAYDIKILSFISNPIEKIFTKINISTDFAKGIASGLIEMTRGLADIKFTTNLKLKLIISTSLISFGGLSVFIQSMTFLNKTKIKALYLLKIKCIQLITSIIVSTIFAIIVY